MLPPLRCLQFLLLSSLFAPSLQAQAQSVSAKLPNAHGAADFDGATQDARKLQLAPEWKLDVWAADPQLANAVAFSMRATPGIAQPGATPILQSFVAESFRWANSVFDITQKTNWLLADMSFRSVGDRAAFLSREYATNRVFLTKDSEQIRLVEDRDGDHRADHSEIFADGFNSIVDGTAAGILAYGTNVWLANIPNLTRLTLSGTTGEPASSKDAPKTSVRRGNASREDLATGFGVHIGVSGHDLHGLIRGPDGRLYMSIGDRGLSITNREGVILNLPDCGSVLRCEPDGSHLEVFCYGLRNPQELAFDDLGNLWTVDNDTAGADPCRLLHLVEDGDYGWRTSYQHMEGFGPWVQEELWKGGQDGILPLAGTVSQGPSGLAYSPGALFDSRFEGAFLHCDFPAGIVLFTVKPAGSSFTLDRKERFLWNCWSTDVEFGPDGAVYVLDWVTGWGRPEKGRIHRITPSTPVSDGIAKAQSETFRLLADGMSGKPLTTVLEGLRHPDRRVRLDAQWELAARGQESLAPLCEVAHFETARLSRLHALWAIRQIARAHRESSAAWDLAQWNLLAMAFDADHLVAAEAALALSEVGWTDWNGILGELLEDPDPTIRRLVAGAGILTPSTPAARPFKQSPDQLVTATGKPWAAEAMARWKKASQTHAGLTAVVRCQKILRDTPDDRFLEHAAARTLFAGVGSSRYTGADLSSALADVSKEVHQVALLALRRVAHHSLNGRGVVGSGRPLGSVGPLGVQLTNALADPQWLVAAGRAIHDVPVVEGFPALASFITKIDCPTNLHSRVIDACYRLGTQQHAQMLAGFAARRDVPEVSRVLALQALADWERPSPLDRVNGLWRPLMIRQATASPSTNSPTSRSSNGNPLLNRAAELQTTRNFGRAAELPTFPSDLGRSAGFDEATHLRRNPAPAQRAFLRVAGELMDPSSPTEAGLVISGGESKLVQLAVVQTAVSLRTKEASSPLYEKFLRTNTFPEVRRAIVPALAKLNSGTASEAVRLAIQDPDPLLKASAVPYLDRLDGEEGFRLLSGLAMDASGDRVSRQSAWRELGNRAGAASSSTETQRRTTTDVLARGLDQLLQGKLPAHLQLDLLEAGAASSDPSIRAQLKQWSDSLPKDNPLAAHQPALEGGNAQNGRRLFLEKPETQCVRCHKIANNGGTVGPGLDGVGKRLSRQQLLESIVTPNAQIAAGFENVVLTLKNGTSIAGTLKQETNGQLLILSGEEGEVNVNASDVQSRQRGLSAMPDGLATLLTRFELRDLIEYLASLK